MKRLTSLFLSALFLMILSAPTAAAAEDLLPAVRSYPGLSDVSGTWCEDAVRVCYETGLLNGTTETTFSPWRSVSVLEVTVLGARLHAAFRGLSALPTAPDGALTCRFLDENGRDALSLRDYRDWSGGRPMYLLFPAARLQPLSGKTLSLVVGGQTWCSGTVENTEYGWRLVIRDLGGRDSQEILAGLRQGLLGLSAPAWARDALAYLVDQGLQPYFDYPYSTTLFLPATRLELMNWLESLIPMEKLTPINEVTELPDVPVDQYWTIHNSGRTYTEGNIAAFYRAGILAGTDPQGTFAGSRTITRGETAAILARILRPSLRLRFTLEPVDWPMEYTLTPLHVSSKDYWTATANWNFPYSGGTDPLECRILRLSQRDSSGDVDFDRDGIVDVSGRWLVEPGRYGNISPYSNGVAEVATTHYMGTAKYGYIDAQGREIVPPVYDATGPNRDGLLLVGGKDGYTVLNLQGKPVASLPGTVQARYGVSAQRAVYAGENGNLGFLDLAGKPVTEAVYDAVAPFSEGLAAVEQNGRVGFLNPSGQTVLPFRYASWRSDDGFDLWGGYRFQNGVCPAAVEQADGSLLYGLINASGGEVTPFRYQFLEETAFAGRFFFARWTGDGQVYTQGFLSPGGEETVIDADPALQLMAWSEGYTLVCYSAGTYSYVDESGRLLAPLNFTDASPILDGQAIVQLSDGEYYRLTLKNSAA